MGFTATHAGDLDLKQMWNGIFSIDFSDKDLMRMILQPTQYFPDPPTNYDHSWWASQAKSNCEAMQLQRSEWQSTDLQQWQNLYAIDRLEDRMIYLACASAVEIVDELVTKGGCLPLYEHIKSEGALRSFRENITRNSSRDYSMPDVCTAECADKLRDALENAVVTCNGAFQKKMATSLYQVFKFSVSSSVPSRHCAQFLVVIVRDWCRIAFSHFL